jgi:ankyrin repeat protein
MIENNPLLKAVLRRCTSEISECIFEGEDLFYKDDHGRTYLHLSVFLRSEEIVQVLLTEGLKVNERDQDKVTALHRACRSGCESIVDILLVNGAEINAEAVNSVTPLHIASAFGHTRCIQLLCSKTDQIEIDCRDDSGHSPLHYAAAEGQIQATNTLIKYGCDVNAENSSGNRPLHFAAPTDLSELCLALVQASADVDAQNYNGQTALHLATQQASLNTVFYLLGAEADPNIRDNNGNTCAHLAIKNGHIEILKMLMLDSRTDTSISDNEENTVLHVALKLGHHNLIPIMLPRARDLTRQNASGCSVIIEAIKSQLEDIALEMLKTCPSLVHTATHDLVTPLHLAAERGMTNLTKQLLIAGAQVDATDSTGLTPSLYCAKNDAVLECLAMIEDIMMIADNNDEQQQHQQPHVKGNKISSRISS